MAAHPRLRPHLSLPPPAVLPPPQEAASKRLDALVASGADIDADAIARWSLATFLAYLFGEKAEQWRPEYECLVRASWEWRKVSRGAWAGGDGGGL